MIKLINKKFTWAITGGEKFAQIYKHFN